MTKRLLIITWFAVLLGVTSLFSVWRPTELPLAERLPLKLMPLFTEGGRYLVGGDEQGRPILVHVLAGMATSIRISLLAVTVALLLGLPYGILAAWRGGWWERSFLFLADCFQAFPGILLAIALAAFLPPSIVNLVLILGVMGWVGFARLARAQVLSLREREFLQATKAMGLPAHRVVACHLLPNMPLVVQASFALAGVILAEATLSFLGLGLPPAIPSLGKMMDSGVRYLLLAPHLAMIPGLAIFSLVLTFNLLGDALADHLDPKR